MKVLETFNTFSFFERKKSLIFNRKTLEGFEITKASKVAIEQISNGMFS